MSLASGHDPVTVLSARVRDAVERFWAERFGCAPAMAIGRTLGFERWATTVAVRLG